MTTPSGENARRLAEQFRVRYGTLPRIFRAPGRVNLIGEHTDYNQGFVLPVAISHYTYAAVARRNDDALRVASLNFPDSAEARLSKLIPRHHWSDYVFGVAHALAAGGCRLRGADLLVYTEIPVGAGLSSSAALEIAAAKALLAVADGLAPPLVAVAAAAQQAENDFVGMKCGIMDQFISAFGRAGNALLLDCRTLDFELVPLPRGYSIVVCNTGVRHELAASAYNQRRAECEEGVRWLRRSLPGLRSLRDLDSIALESRAAALPAPVLKRCRHVVSENARVQAARAALSSGHMAAVCRLFAQSHASLRDDYEVSCPELDSMVEIAGDAPGFSGGRMTGGGFGGCTVNLVASDRAESFRSQVMAAYGRRWPARHGEAYVVESADGGCEVTPGR